MSSQGQARGMWTYHLPVWQLHMPGLLSHVAHVVAGVINVGFHLMIWHVFDYSQFVHVSKVILNLF